MIWLGITVGDMDENPHETKNPFVFSDGTEIDDSNFIYKWAKDSMAGYQPYANPISFVSRCSLIHNKSGTETTMSYVCDGHGSAYGLCKTYEKC